MKCENILAELEKRFPPETAEEWDNPGLLVGHRTAEIKRIFVTLDVTEEAIKEAVAREAELIVSHHPLIFSSIRKVNDADRTGRRILALAEHGIACYAMHTNYDVCRMADLNAAQLSLDGTEVLMPTGETDGAAHGIGRVGLLPEAMSLAQLCAYVKERMQIPALRCYGDSPQAIRRVAVSGGSGRGMAEYAFRAGAEALITGDVDYHSAIDAVADGLCVLDAGHYGTEQIFIEDVAETLQRIAPDCRVIAAGKRQPFSVI